MNTFAKVPTARLQWDGVGWYNAGFQEIRSYELVLKRKDKNDIRVGEYVLSYDEAYELYTDLVSATLAVVVQKGNRKHAISIETVVQVVIPNPVGSDDTEVPADKVPEIIEWLRFVLGITPYTFDPDEWEF